MSRTSVDYPPLNMGGRRYYTFARRNVRFFVLDTNALDPPQLRWLETELKAAREAWKISYFHHPLYSSAGRHGSAVDIRLLLEPLFLKYGVHVVFSGHDHAYERLKPQHGIHYFVSGAGGQLRKGDLERSETQRPGSTRISRSCSSKSTRTSCSSRWSRGPASPSTAAAFDGHRAKWHVRRDNHERPGSRSRPASARAQSPQPVSRVWHFAPEYSWTCRSARHRVDVGERRSRKLFQHGRRPASASTTSRWCILRLDHQGDRRSDVARRPDALLEARGPASRRRGRNRDRPSCCLAAVRIFEEPLLEQAWPSPQPPIWRSATSGKGDLRQECRRAVLPAPGHRRDAIGFGMLSPRGSLREVRLELACRHDGGGRRRARPAAANGSRASGPTCWAEACPGRAVLRGFHPAFALLPIVPFLPTRRRIRVSSWSAPSARRAEPVRAMVPPSGAGGAVLLRSCERWRAVPRARERRLQLPARNPAGKAGRIAHRRRSRRRLRFAPSSDAPGATDCPRVYYRHRVHGRPVLCDRDDRAGTNAGETEDGRAAQCHRLRRGGCHRQSASRRQHTPATR